MSLLDELAKGQVYKEHLCMIPTKYGREPRTESHLFAYTSDLNKIFECMCGREFKAVRTSSGYILWKER